MINTPNTDLAIEYNNDLLNHWGSNRMIEAQRTQIESVLLDAEQEGEGRLEILSGKALPVLVSLIAECDYERGYFLIRLWGWMAVASTITYFIL